MKRIFLGVLIVLSLLLALGIFFPYLFKGRIVRLIESELNKGLEAELRFDHDIRLNLFRSFPKLRLEVDDIVIRSTKGTFSNDTLFYVGELRTDLDLLDLYRSDRISVQRLEVERPFMHIEFNADSAFNWDIFPEEESTDSSSIALQLDRFVLNAGRFRFLDETIDVDFQLNNINNTAKIQMQDDRVDLDAETSVQEVFFSYLGVPYLAGHRFEQNGPMELDLDAMRFTFPDNRCKVNGLDMDAQVVFQLLDDGQFYDITVDGAQSTLPHYISLIPAVFQSDYTSMVSQGTGSLQFRFKGMMNETSFPSYHLGITLDNGAFHYPQASAKAQDIRLDLRIDNPTGQDADAVVDVKELKAVVNGQSFALSTRIDRPFTAPSTTGWIKGALDLAQLAALVPQEGGNMEGKVALDVAWSGPLEQVERFTASGDARLDKIRMQPAHLAHPLEIAQADIHLDNNLMSIRDLKGTYGPSDLDMHMECRDFLPYARSEGTLRAQLRLNSNSLDLNDLMQEFSNGDSAAASSGTDSSFQLPTDLDIEFKAQCTTLELGKETYRNLIAEGQLKEGVLRLDQFRSDAFGGGLAMQATLQTSGTPKLDLNVDATDILLQSVLERFAWVRKFVPVASTWNPKSTIKLQFSSVLDKDLKPKLDLLSAAGKFAFDQLSLQELPWAQSLDKDLGFKHFGAKEIRDLMVAFRVRDGRLFVDPIRLVLDQTQLNLEGSSKLDGSLDYIGSLDIPSSLFEGRTQALNSLLKGSNVTNYQWSPQDRYQLGLTVGGTFSNPNVELNMDAIRSGVGDQVKAQLQREQERLQQRADQQVQSVKDSLERAATAAQARLQSEAERQRLEAEARLKAEADRKKKEAEAKAKERLKGILGK